LPMLLIFLNWRTNCRGHCEPSSAPGCFQRALAPIHTATRTGMHALACKHAVLEPLPSAPAIPNRSLKEQQQRLFSVAHFGLW
jgi:hypothetical protein